MLMSAGLPLPRQVFGHGFVYNKEGSKDQQVGRQRRSTRWTSSAVHGADAFRYYFMRECPFGGDGNFSDERFAEVYNADLANNLGNLYSRTLSMCVKYFDGRLDGSRRRRSRPPGAPDSTSSALVTTSAGSVGTFQYNVALQRIWLEVLDAANRYIEVDRALQAGQDRPRGLQGRPDQPGRGVPRRRHPDQAVPAQDGRDVLSVVQL